MYRIYQYKMISVAAFLLAVCILLPAGNFLAAQENVPALRFGFQAGKQYAFEVKIQAEEEKYDEIRQGVLTYTVTSAKDSEFVLRPSGNLPVQIKPHPNEMIIPRGFPPMGPMVLRGFGGPQGITFNRQGEKIVSRELTPLPYLLGDMELLVIEEFPAQAKPSWEKEREVEVVERDSSGPFPRLAFATRFDSGKHTAAKEQINYSIVKKEDNTLEISKKYSLRSIPEADKPSRFELTGEGQFIFDLGEGVIRSLTMNYECRENEKNVIRKYPITLTFHLLSPEELAEHQKKAEQSRAAMEKAKEPKEFASGERAQLIKDLRSSDTHRIQSAADRLAKAPADENPAEVAKALLPLLDNSDEWVQRAAAKALVVWATPETENALIKASQSDDVFVRGPVIQALGKLKTAKAAEAVAAQMYQQNNRQDVSKALKAMGPIAEEATINLLKDRDMWVRGEACSVLGEIGGKKSLQALRDFSPKSRGFEEMNAKKAITDIERRLESAAESGADAKTN